EAEANNCRYSERSKDRYKIATTFHEIFQLLNDRINSIKVPIRSIQYIFCIENLNNNVYSIDRSRSSFPVF
ncbi:MAG: hypothetical protein ACRC2V_24540, partial [Xenococcaceae cyanobacterium]